MCRTFDTRVVDKLASLALNLFAHKNGMCSSVLFRDSEKVVLLDSSSVTDRNEINMENQ